jgi:hypothetical protein
MNRPRFYAHQFLSEASRVAGRAGVSRLAHHHRGQAGVRRIVTWDRRVDRCVGRLLTDLCERGLGCPLLVVSDSAKDLIAATEQIYPKALRQRCLIIDSGTCSPRFPPGCKPRSATATGDFRYHRPQHRTGTPAGRDRRQANRGVRRQILRPLPSGYPAPAHRQRGWR